MTANPPLRTALWLGLTAVAGVTGWVGGRAAKEGLYPDSRTARHSASPPQQIAGPREPRVDPGTPGGNWMTRVKAAESGDFAALLEELDTLLPKEGHWAERGAAQKWLLALWISKGLDAALAYVAAQQDKLLGSTFGLLLGSLAPDKVAAILAGPHKSDLGEYFPAAALRSLAATDPRAFLKLDAYDPGTAWSRHWPRALASLADTDPAAAAAVWTAAGSKAQSRNSALFSLLSSWTERDLPAARQWAESLTNETDRQIARHAWLGTLARRDSRAALKELAGMDAGEFLPDRRGTLNARGGSMRDARVEIVDALAKENFQEALAAMQELGKAMKPPANPSDPSDSRRNDPLAVMRQALVKSAAPGLPDEPAPLLSALKNLASTFSLPGDNSAGSSLGLLLLQEKAAAWNADTVFEAVKLLAGDASAPGREQGMPALLSLAAVRDPAKTAGALATLSDEVKGIAAVAMVSRAGGLMHLNREYANAMTAAAPLVPASQWTEELGRTLGREPAENAATVAALPDSPQAGAARNGFVAQWGKMDPEAAAQWVAALPQDSRAVESARGLTDAWARQDDNAASAWAASLPPGTARDGAALGLASGLVATEPEAAWQWAASVSNPALSANAFLSVARQWGNQAPAEFRTAFSTALDRGGYTGDLKAEALKNLDQPPGTQGQPSPP